VSESNQDTPRRTRSTAATIWPSLAFAAVVAGTASYLAALTVTRATVSPPLVAFLVAALADPVVLASSANIKDAHRSRARLPRWSMASFAVAFAMTVYLNVMAAFPHDVPPWLVRAWVPVAFLLTLESLMSYSRRGRGGPGAHAPAAQIHPVAAAATPTREWLDRHLRAWLADMTPRELEAAIGVSRGRIKAAMTTDVSAPPLAPGAETQTRPGGREECPPPGRPPAPAPPPPGGIPSATHGGVTAGAGAQANGNRPQ
jgi:hypothetical protein